MDFFTNEKCYVISVDFATPEYDQTIQLRDEVLMKPLGLEFDVDQLSLEYEAFHLACYSNENKLLGCLVLSPVDEDIVEIRLVAVDNNLKKKDGSHFLIQASESFSKARGYKQIMLHAEINSVPFYEQMKYKKKGRAFQKSSVKHYKMYKIFE